MEPHSKSRVFVALFLTLFLFSADQAQAVEIKSDFTNCAAWLKNQLPLKLLLSRDSRHPQNKDIPTAPGSRNLVDVDIQFSANGGIQIDGKPLKSTPGTKTVQLESSYSLTQHLEQYRSQCPNSPLLKKAPPIRCKSAHTKDTSRYFQVHRDVRGRIIGFTTDQPITGKGRTIGRTHFSSYRNRFEIKFNYDQNGCYPEKVTEIAYVGDNKKSKELANFEKCRGFHEVFHQMQRKYDPARGVATTTNGRQVRNRVVLPPIPANRAMPIHDFRRKLERTIRGMFPRGRSMEFDVQNSANTQKDVEQYRNNWDHAISKATKMCYGYGEHRTDSAGYNLSQFLKARDGRSRYDTYVASQPARPATTAAPRAAAAACQPAPDCAAMTWIERQFTSRCHCPSAPTGRTESITAPAQVDR